VHQRPAGALFIHADRCEAHGVADINAQQFVSPQPRHSTVTTKARLRTAPDKSRSSHASMMHTRA
jgi:hypothetical protein